MKARDWRIVVLVVGVAVIGCGEVRACTTAPVAVIKPNLEYRSGRYHTMVGAKVVFDLRDSFDPDPDDYIVKYKLEFWVDGVTKDLELTQCLEDCPGGKRDHYFDGIVTRVFNGSCSYFMVLTVTDNHGASSDYCFWLLVHMSVAKEPPRSFGTITAALTGWLYDSENWASSEVWVAPGWYQESVTFDAGHDGLILRSSDPTDAEVVGKTAITAVSPDSNVVVFVGNGITEATKLQGFTVEGPWGTPGDTGKGIYCKGGSPVIENCVIRGHYTGVYNDAEAYPVISNCVICDNDEGSGMVNNGASAAEPVKVRNCIFTENLNTDNGGGIHNADTELELTNCTIYGNEAQYPSYGGGVHNHGDGSLVTMKNCIIWGNMARDKQDEIDNWEGAGAVTAEYSDIRDRLNSSSVYGMALEDFVECIGEDVALHDPKFAAEGEPAGADGIFGTLDDGFRLKPGSGGSPCIDKGNDSEAPATDIIGKDRVNVPYIEDGNGGYSDMGAYEAPTVWFVDAAEGGDGKSWDGAFTDLQDALADANSGDEIWVAKGEYEPGAQRSESFELVSGVEVYGGFPAGADEPSWADRDWLENTTTLSGDIDDIGDDDSYHVVKGADDAVIDGFVISGGRADGEGVDYRGGGMYNEGCSPVVRNCKFTGNYALDGGGMYNKHCSPEVRNCVLSGNRAMWGGGVSNYSASPKFEQCVFVENEAVVRGGGMFNEGATSNPDVVNCVFQGNSSLGGGGMYNGSRGSHPTITNCTLTGNDAFAVEGRPPHGGGMFNFAASPTVTNCIFWGNTCAADPGSKEVYNYEAAANPSFRASDVNGCGGSPPSYGPWNANFGNDGGGNIDADPQFADADNPKGLDDKWMTVDDGLRLGWESSPCVDAADGDAAPEKDIRGFGRYDVVGAGGGVGQPDYVDIGAYECSFSMIAGGELHTLVIRPGDTLWACGDNLYGQLGTDTGNVSSLVQVLDGEMDTSSDYLEDIVFVDAGWTHSLAIDLSGYVWAWGGNGHGQLGDNTTITRTTAVKVRDEGGYDQLRNIAKVAAGRSGLYSLACNNTVNKYAWAWGRNEYGQLGDGTRSERLIPVHVKTASDSDLGGIIDIDAGIYHSIALDESEGVWTWGYNEYGQLGNGKDKDYYGSPEDSWEAKAGKVVGKDGIGELSDIEDVAVTCGLYGAVYGYRGSSYAVEGTNGYVWAWGYNGEYGKIGQGDNTVDSYYKTPVEVLEGARPGEGLFLRDIIAVSGGNHHVLALDADGDVWAWGDNKYGQLGNGETLTQESEPVQVMKGVNDPLTDIVYIDAGFWHSMAIGEFGQIWVWGRNAYGQLGLGDDQPRFYATMMP